MIGITIGWDWEVLGLRLVGLFAFGVFFAYTVYRLKSRHRGYTSLLVVLGTLITVLTVSDLIGANAVLILLMAFAASGVPMIAGDVLQGIREREAAETASREIQMKLAERGIRQANEVNHDPQKAASQSRRRDA